MSHSIYNYLKRRTTEELDCILKLYLEDADLDLNGDVILMILQILREREQVTPMKLSSESMERIKSILQKNYEE